jgi:opacity protein-like surface antigen
MSRRILAIVLLAVGLAASAAAQDAQPAQATPSPGPFEHVVFGVGLEGFYQYNWNEPYDRINLLRAYDTRSNVFGIQQANVIVESVPAVDKGRRFGARVDLQFGQATETVQGGAANEPRPDVYRHIWQAYGTYVFPVGRGLQADFGKFGSNLGYETTFRARICSTSCRSITPACG